MEHGEPLERELLRYIVHGLLHLAGHEDGDEEGPGADDRGAGADRGGAVRRPFLGGSTRRRAFAQASRAPKERHLAGAGTQRAALAIRPSPLNPTLLPRQLQAAAPWRIRPSASIEGPQGAAPCRCRQAARRSRHSTLCHQSDPSPAAAASSRSLADPCGEGSASIDPRSGTLQVPAGSAPLSPFDPLPSIRPLSRGSCKQPLLGGSMRRRAFAQASRAPKERHLAGAGRQRAALAIRPSAINPTPLPRQLQAAAPWRIHAAKGFRASIEGPQGAAPCRCRQAARRSRHSTLCHQSDPSPPAAASSRSLADPCGEGLSRKHRGAPRSGTLQVPARSAPLSPFDPHRSIRPLPPRQLQAAAPWRGHLGTSLVNNSIRYPGERSSGVTIGSLPGT